jgi:DNA ligase (NAD+)
MPNIIDAASEAYYAGQPILTDEEFDALEQPEYVGHKISGIQHLFPMWSLQKAYDGDDPLSWYKGYIVESPKLDGAAISLKYQNGVFVQALTRGNGKEGLDITDKIIYLVPRIVPWEGTIQITGEVVAPKHIKNARNYAAGALNLKSVEEFHTRDLYFIAYGMTPNEEISWELDMYMLKLVGFNTVLKGIDLDQFPQDGAVYRIDSYEDFAAAGFTSKHPRGAYAAKERTSGSITRLLDVEWNVGRSGVVAPTAVLEPVLVGDAIVSRATLHNMAYINALDLEIGCYVEVIRSGEIIPRIIKRVENYSPTS